jgi:phosphatidylserine/phosphatidylglycerophosphate/cardiolipin synthase-like enzyme
MAARVRPYLSPTLVLLALDWPEGEGRNDFLGFAIKRSPGFLDLKTNVREASSWLPNRIGFNGPPPEGAPDFPSDEAPVQKFMWWDARLEGLTPADAITYEVWATTGNPAAGKPVLEAASKTDVTIQLPHHVEQGIGTWFNRAVMSSQSFSRKVNALNLGGAAPTAAQALDLRLWLTNGMEQPVPDFIGNASSLAGAIYHLTDKLWVIPAMKTAMGGHEIGLVYDSHQEVDSKTKKTKPSPNQGALDELTDVTFSARDKTNIMHDKFLVAGTKLLAKKKQVPLRLTCGSANYTTEGFSSQANLVHTFESADLASLYFTRYQALKDNPTLGKTAKGAGWSKTVSVGDAGIRLFFSPEKGKPNIDRGESIETIVQAVHAATSSVVFCLFTPTDADLRDACFSVGDGGKMMFGLVNHVAGQEPELKPTSTGKIPADQIAALEIFHRSRDNKDVIGAEFFSSKLTPAGFVAEMNLFPGEKPPPYPPVIIHHKFIIIDAETDTPTIYTGSANMSGNSVFKNDENLLEIKGSPRLARVYLSEFMRLYEHYRARARFIAWKKSGSAPAGFSLRKNASWCTQHFKPGTPEYKARVRLLSLA